MKCTFISNVDVNPAAMTDEQKQLVKFRQTTVGGKQSFVPYFPAGTTYEHENAHVFCLVGSAVPADEETAMIVGLEPEELLKRQATYKRTAAGILPADTDLFDSGVIAGYKQDGSYIEGPNWAKHAETLAAIHAAAKDEDI